MGVAGEARDLDAVRAGLQAWLVTRHHDRPALQVDPLTRPTAGLSSETFFVDVTWPGGSEQLVARLPPLGGGLFPAYDLSLQARLQQRLPDLGIPAAPATYEADPAWVGTPFMLMPRLPGRLLADNPPFARKGWLRDAGPDDQRTLYEGFIDVLARIHRIDWRAAGLGWAARGEVGADTHLAQELDWWSAHLEWAGDGDPPPELTVALAWCRANQPDPEPPPSLLWGDVRLGNVIFDDTLAPAAVIDWEMASIGPAELDIGWFMALREMVLAPGAVELPGFLDRPATLARYAASLGRPLDDLWWYELFALVRSAAILLRMQRLLVAQGETDHWLVGFDPVPARIRAFFEA